MPVLTETHAHLFGSTNGTYTLFSSALSWRRRVVVLMLFGSVFWRCGHAVFMDEKKAHIDEQFFHIKQQIHGRSRGQKKFRGLLASDISISWVPLRHTHIVSGQRVLFNAFFRTTHTTRTFFHMQLRQTRSDSTTHTPRKCFQCLPSSTSRFKANLAEHVVRSWTFTLAEHVVHGGGRPHFVVHLIVQHRGTAVLATSCAMDCLPAKKTDAQIVSKRQC